ncbi:hypothetical protein [Lactobacillus paragasseri]|uniref:hypothetical protein n=1 Tax=Lactobacillus paragasseri TaxID=2107999 RepID=UPI00217D2E52|nr:hypothetical protein [Lactobacillus paragasseri]UWI43492.1 hypothetical protein HR119_04560 [Lactobacillus paragasseri]UWI44735.1 hypothetical protein HR117_01840 [Lactobacillus paragasseri]
MEEQEVLTRLGLSDGLSEVDQLKGYEINYSNNDENVFNLSDKSSTSLSELVNKFLSYKQNLLPILTYEYGRIIITGWRVYLDARLKEKVKLTETGVHDPSWIKEKYSNADVNTVDALMFDRLRKDGRLRLSSKYRIEGGHILGQFTNLIPLIEDYLRSDQRVDHIDMYPQFKQANENTKQDHGQLYFEDMIRDDNAPYYYEAEAIFADIFDKVPIGTRLRIVKLEKSEDDTYKYLPIRHVFIPNRDYSKENGGDNLLPYENYREFFKNGNLRKLREV